MIILRSPKGWTGPEMVDGIKVSGSWRSHQVPLSGVRDNPEHLALLEQWLKSYRPGGAVRRRPGCRLRWSLRPTRSGICG